jgi:hypothetical protein
MLVDRSISIVAFHGTTQYYPSILWAAISVPRSGPEGTISFEKENQALTREQQIFDFKTGKFWKN